MEKGKAHEGAVGGSSGSGRGAVGSGHGNAGEEEEDDDDDDDDDDDVNTEEALQRRRALREDPEIRSMLRAWWAVADADGSGGLEHDEYAHGNSNYSDLR
jgi:hypothetical protein